MESKDSPCDQTQRSDDKAKGGHYQAKRGQNEEMLQLSALIHLSTTFVNCKNQCHCTAAMIK